MKVVAPSRLLSEAADVLGEVRDSVVVIGGGNRGCLAEQASVVITPTRDVDIVVPVERAARIVACLEAADMRRSDVEHERTFTWVRGDLKVQLLRGFHPFAKPPAIALPANPAFDMAANPVHQTAIAFTAGPGEPRLYCANAVCLLALKQAAFGRTRPTSALTAERATITTPTFSSPPFRRGSWRSSHTPNTKCGPAPSMRSPNSPTAAPLLRRPPARWCACLLVGAAECSSAAVTARFALIHLHAARPSRRSGQGGVRALRPGSAAAIYRLVQEALTNANRHAHGAPVTVWLGRENGALRLTVHNGAGEAPEGAPGSGHGLPGMRERVKVFGGRLTAGATPQGGFLVDVTLPVQRER